MKTYTKTHSNKTALKNHLSKIKKRGGLCSVKGMTVKYHFSGINGLEKKYDTKAKRIAFVKTKGNIVTFKKPFRWKDRDFEQILVHGIEKSKGSIKIVGFTRDSPWYKSMDELLKAIDWKQMEEMHEDQGPRYF